MKIPFVDVGAQHKELQQEIKRAIDAVIERSNFILGEEVGAFETEFARLCSAPYAVGVGSGTSALFLALLSLGIGKGDEVIVPAFTYIATSLAVSYTQATPVFVDIEEKTYNIDVAKIKKAITKKTKAIIPVHLYGQPADMRAVMKLASENNLSVIEDAAQAHGATATVRGEDVQTVGGIGDIGCFSFYPSKNLGALGDGGMVVTRHKELYDKLLKLRDYGRVSKYEHEIIGYNSRLDTLQAAVLRVKLKKLLEWNSRRQKVATLYNKALSGLKDVVTPYVCEDVSHVYHVYALRTKCREALFAKLAERGIGCVIHYPIPLHLQKAYKALGYTVNNFPVSEKVAKEIISLPMFPHMSEEQVDCVCRTVKETVENNG